MTSDSQHDPREPAMGSRQRAGTALFCVILLLCATAARAAGPQHRISEDRLRDHCTFLASDALEGREAGADGGRAAAAYLRQQLQQAGLQPGAGDGDFYQEFGRGYRNLIAVHPGGDPELRHEYILIGAHYDHVGYARRGNAYGPIGLIHNGADDNASGVAALLEIARVIGGMDPAPRRSVLFVLWDAEEIGLLGSQHWMRHPTAPRDRVRLGVNVDMIGRLRNETVNIRGIRTMRGLRRLLVQANADSELEFAFDLRHKEDSDHYPFYEARIPYLSFDTGKHGDYHRPSDDAHRINYEGLQRVATCLLQLVQIAGDAGELPEFRRESIPEAGRGDAFLVDNPPPVPVRLGVGWEPRSDLSEPIRITEVDAGSPAARAGLQVGDAVLSAGGVATTGRDDFRVQIALAAGPVDLLVLREAVAEPVSLTVELAGEPLPWGMLLVEDPAEPHLPVVARILRGSPAEAAGIHLGDRLVTGPRDDGGGLLRVGPGGDAPGGNAGEALHIERNGRLRRVRLPVQEASLQQPAARPDFTERTR